MKQFVMGAKLTMQDVFSKGISAAGKATKAFSATVGGATSVLVKYAQQTDRAKQSTKKFKDEGDGASVRARGWISSNGKLGASFALVKNGIITAAAAFGLWRAKSWLIDSNADMETYRSTLNIVMKDTKKAGETLEWAVKFAAATPFEIPQVVEATTRLTTYGFEAQKVVGIVGDMAGVMGKDLMQAVEAVADAQTGEVERLKEFGITKKMLEDRAKKMNLKIVDSKGSITNMKTFNAVLFKLMEERFKGGMAAQSKTWKGMISNAKDFIGSMGRTLGAPIFDRLKLQLDRIMKWAQDIQKSGIFEKWAADIGRALDKVDLYFANLSSDSNFKNMSLPEKFIFVLRDMLTQANTYMAGPGGDQVKGVFKLVTKTLIEVLQGAFTELMPIATAIGTQIGIAIVAGIGDAIAAEIKAPSEKISNGFNSLVNDILTNPGKLFKSENSSFGLLKKLISPKKETPAAETSKTSKVGQNAAGTHNWRGGWSWVGERGPELMKLPGGTRIASNYESRQMANPAVTSRASSAGGRVSIGSLVEKIIIEGGDKDPKEMAAAVMEELHELMRQAKEIAGSADMEALLE